MAYRATYLNRLAQFGSVSYDLLIDDNADPQVLPSLRVSVKFSLSQDTAANRNATALQWRTEANLRRSLAYRRQLLRDLKDQIDVLIAQYIELRDRLQDRIDRDDLDP